MIAGLWIVLAAMFVVVASLVAAATAGVERLLARAPRWARVRATWPHAALLLAPVVAASSACVALAAQNPFSSCHCDLHGLHHLHLCFSHPELAKPLVLPSAFALALWALAVAPRVARLAREIVAGERWARSARSRLAEPLDEIRVRVVDEAGHGAFTAGALAPVIVIGRALWEKLPAAQRRAVAHHEHGHVVRRDPLTQLALRLCAALSPLPHRGDPVARWRAAAESACDRHAAHQLGSGADVAEALLSVERARAGATAHVPAAALGASGDLERRVLDLLEVRPVDEHERLLGNDLLAVAALACGTGVLALFWPGDALHHAIETGIGLFIR